MPELIDLGFCPCCFSDLHEEPSSVIIHARFCRICANAIRGDEHRERKFLALAESMRKELDK